MNETKLPDGLDLAQNLISHAWHVGACSKERMEFAAKSIDTEHAQRLTLQHHAADQAQRIAELEKERDELRARLTELEYTRPVPAIPAGWKLVPVEPTPEMLEAGLSAQNEAWNVHYTHIYAAMLAAAPEAAR
jgi:hypothetical protein